MTATAGAGRRAAYLPLRRRWARQPALGLAGLTLVIPPAVLLAVGAGGAEPSLVVFAPLVTFALPVIAMIAFWWNDWPGSRLRPGWSGLLDTALVVIAAVVLTMAGQLVVAGTVDLRGIFDPTPGAGHAPTYPQTLPLAGAAFVAMLQITLVSERWPLQRIGPTLAGVLALVASWAIGLVAWAALVGPLTGAEVGAACVLIGAWQVAFFVVWQGWPFTSVDRLGPRIALANAAVLGGALVAYVSAHELGGASAEAVTAAAGSFIAGGLLAGMLWEGTLGRTATLVAGAVLAAGLFAGLRAIAGTVDWTRGSADEWVAHVGLNAIGVSVILHVGIGLRWPFDAGGAADE